MEGSPHYMVRMGYSCWRSPNAYLFLDIMFSMTEATSLKFNFLSKNSLDEVYELDFLLALHLSPLPLYILQYDFHLKRTVQNVEYIAVSYQLFP